MSHVPKRLASTATKFATISTAHLKAFPPREAIVSRTPSSSKTQEKPNFFDAETWAVLQPPNPATLSAFAHRIGLGKTLPDPADAIQQACTHPSFLPLFAKHQSGKPAPATNGNLAALGNSLLGLFAAEHVNATYPHLPTRVMKAAVSAYVGPTTCTNIAKEMGANHILRWNRTVSVPLCGLAPVCVDVSDDGLSLASLKSTLSGSSARNPPRKALRMCASAFGRALTRRSFRFAFV